MTNTEKQSQALTRAVSSQSMMNYTAIYEGFIAMGIPEDQIRPRENIFSFNAWKALGRYVRRGQHGVRVCTFVPKEQKDGTTKTFPHYTTVFHVSQTEPMNGNAASAPAQAVAA